MKKIEFENELYYYKSGILYDESFIAVPLALSTKVLSYYYETIDYSSYDEVALLELIKEIKASNSYAKCVEVIEYGLKKFAASLDFVKTVFPMLTSCYRSMGMPKKAIEFWEEHKRIFASCISPALLTSLAAAYCDEGDYIMARKFADRAYVLKGGSQGYKDELSLVYLRIKREFHE